MTPEQSIVFFCKELHQKGYLAACDGNLSIRLPNGQILMTPSARHKGYITEEDLCLVSLDNQILKGNPSGERLMHLEIYKQCPQAKAIVHAHPPVCVAWSVSKPNLKELPNNVLSEVILAVGRIPIIPFATPGTLEMGKALEPELPHSRAMILARHGALAWGDTILEAYCGIERIEHAALTLHYATTLGTIQPLSEVEFEVLSQMRQKGPQRIF